MSAPAATPSPTPSPSVRVSARSTTQWDRCLENGAIKSAYGLVIGGLASIVLFRSGGSRLALTGFGAGIGAGQAWFECKQAYAPTRFHNSLLTPAQNAVIANAPGCRCGKPNCKMGADCKCPPVGFNSVKTGVLPTFNVPADAKDAACCGGK